ncbi:hypothetical protein MKS88_005507 [Plasmodium brasilianum]|uniref:Uncharacterized protein n=1 Tax=Plasmodium brasilianum TaxID=5824 RepID=A0ACB9Y2C8_PLABR|nr:hypothetical protein MKS88_005507 [Plasmodium brasilianum]
MTKMGKYLCNHLIRRKAQPQSKKSCFRGSRDIASGSHKNKEYYERKSINLCTAFNNNVNIRHERLDSNCYIYSINSTIFKLLKHVHKLNKKFKKYKRDMINMNDTVMIDKGNYHMKNEIEQIFMCYVSIYNNIKKNLFLRVTLEILNSPVLYKKITDNKNFYEELLYEIIKCANENGMDKKYIIYEYLIKIVSTFLKNKNFLNEIFQRIFFLQVIKILNKEQNINHFAISNFTFLLSCISFYKRNLKTDKYFYTKESQNHYPLLLYHISPDNKFFILHEKKQLLQNCIPMILEIFTKMESYNCFSEIDICNIFDFLHEFKQYHRIKEIICSDIHKYFTTSSAVKHLCFFLYLLASSRNTDNNSTIRTEVYNYIYNIIFLKRNHLTDLKNINLFLLSVVVNHKADYKKYNKNIELTKNEQYKNIFSIKHKEKIDHTKKKFNKKFELCLKLRHRFIKKQKQRKEKIMYFFIKQCFMKLIEKSKLDSKYVKTFYRYFLFYHIKKNCTRKKNYLSPLTIVRNLEL